jgi:hypothetical protein
MTNPTNKLDLCLQEYALGAADVEIARILEMTESQFYDTEAENQAFATFVAKGRTLAKAFWYELSRKNVKNKEFNTPLYVINMKNRYGWADKVDTNDTTDKDPVNLDQMRAQLKKQMEKLAKKDPDLRNILNKDAPNES